VSAADHTAARQASLKSTAIKVERERQGLLHETSLIATRQRDPNRSAGPAAACGGPAVLLAASTFSAAGFQASEQRRRAIKEDGAKKIETERQEALLKTSVLGQRRVIRDEKKRKRAAERTAQLRLETAAVTIQAG
jgi:hypothetical protein